MKVGFGELVVRYEVEPELCAPSPRRIRCTAWPVVIVSTCLALYAMVLSCAACVAVRSAELLFLERSGSTTTARITSSQVGSYPIPINSASDDAYLADKGRLLRQIDLRFPVVSPASHHPELVNRVMNIAPEDSSDLPPSSSIAVRYAWLNGHLVFTPLQSMSLLSCWLSICFAALIGLVATLLFKRWLSWLVGVYRLLKLGYVSIGTVCDKEIVESDIPRYYVTCGYLDADGFGQRHRERCSPEQWRRLQIGEPVSLVCLPADPIQARIYRHLPLRCQAKLGL
jgi:hypothetical protein